MTHTMQAPTNGEYPDYEIIDDMKVPGEPVLVQLARVGPKFAALALSTQRRNRPERRNHRRKIAADMSVEAFPFLGDPARFDWDGHLIDAQHRFGAIVDSGKSVLMIVIWDMDPDLQDYFDDGPARTIAQILGMKGEKNAATLGGIIRWELAWRQWVNASERTRTGPTRRATPPSRRELLAIRDDPAMPLIREAVEQAKNQGKHFPRSETDVNRRTGMPRPMITPSVFAFAYLRCATKEPDEAKQFFYRLARGLADSDRDPVRVLVRTLQRLHPSNSVDDTQLRQLALIFKAWNLYRKNDTAARLQFRLGTEAFPTPI